MPITNLYEMVHVDIVISLHDLILPSFMYQSAFEKDIRACLSGFS